MKNSVGSSSSSSRSTVRPLGSLLKVDPTAKEVSNLNDLHTYRVKGNKDELNVKNEEEGEGEEEVDVETMEKIRYKLIAASYSHWLSAPRDSSPSSSQHKQDRDHIGAYLTILSICSEFHFNSFIESLSCDMVGYPS